MERVRRLWLRTSRGEILNAQDRLLEAFASPERVRLRSLGKKCGINAVEVTRRDGRGAGGRDLVLAHGFGSGLAMWMDSLQDLAEIDGVRRVIAFDWLGMGASDRPACYQSPRVALTPLWKGTSAHDARDFFVDSMEEWRKCVGIDDMVLVGHSLGGFLGAQYALKYPESVKGVTLVSPVGLPEPPPSSEVPPPQSLPSTLRALQVLWSKNVTPQQIVRTLGPWGRDVANNVVSRRFGHRWSDAESRLISDYLWHATVAPASGEYAMNSVLKIVWKRQVLPVGKRAILGVFAHDPIGTRLSDLPGPVRVIYGDNDWLRSPAAEQAVIDAEKGGGDVKLSIAPYSGHHIYIDNTSHFVSAVADIVRRSS